MGHGSFNALQVADYDMTEKEMMDLLDGFLASSGLGLTLFCNPHH